MAAIGHARSMGINFFDTAQAYGFGRSERLLGQALAADLRAARDSVVIATKGGLRMDGENLVRDASPAWLRKGAEASLDALGTDYLGARTPAHLAESLGALNLTLGPDDLAEIDRIMVGAVPVGGPTPEGMS
jgi:aryl-alcohol dehydrogenase-like predicted oxidoreductase